MTYANFKDSVASYMNRTAAAVVTAGSLDLILQAMNDARRAAQREYMFEMTATQAFVPVSLKPKSLLSDFKTTPGGATTVVVRRVDAVWEYTTALVGATTTYPVTATVSFRRRTSITPRVPIAPQSVAVASPLSQDFVYVQGTNIYHTSLTTETSVLCDVLEMLPDHAGGAAADIFLDYFTDWLKFTTLQNLNVWLKDSDRVQIDQLMVNRLWEGVKLFDAQQAVSTEDLTLD